MILKKSSAPRARSRVTGALLFILLGIGFNSISIWADSVPGDLSGYFENRFFLVEYPGIDWNNLDDKFQIGDYNRLRLRYKVSPSDKVTIHTAVDFFSFHGFIKSPLGTYESSSTGEETDDVEINVDRVYVDLHFKGFDLSIGKQRAALGVSYLWAPLDVFNRVNVLEPKEEKPGTNAIKLYIPLGPASSITAIVSPEEKFNTSRYGLRMKTHLLGIDAALTMVRDGQKDYSIYGLDLRGENFIGWWIEAGFVNSHGQEDIKLVLGFDYTFPINDGLYWLSEYYYDSSGVKDLYEYDYSLLLTGDRFTLTRNYFFSLLRYGFTQFLQGSASYIGNWDDGSFILAPTVAYEVSQSISISAGCYFPLGKKGGEFNRANEGAKSPNTYFIWLKVNF